MILIDARSGRLGDCLMRMVGLYAAATYHDVPLEVVPHSSLELIARRIFNRRITVVSNLDRPADYTFSSLGLRRIFPLGFGRSAVAAPYHRTVLWGIHKSSPYTCLKSVALTVLDRFGMVLSPPNSLREAYHGFAEACCLKNLRVSEPDKLNVVCRSIWPELQSNLQSKINGTLDSRVAVFPSGTSQQFMPAAWAAKWLPNANFYFHDSDQRRRTFESAGLQIKIFCSPEDIVRIGQASRWTITTDSFPSHVLQIATNRLTVCLTRERATRVVAPGFGGVVVHSSAACSPCAGPTSDPERCRVGLVECSSWGNTNYSRKVLDSIPRTTND